MKASRFVSQTLHTPI